MTKELGCFGDEKPSCSGRASTALAWMPQFPTAGAGVCPPPGKALVSCLESIRWFCRVLFCYRCGV